MAENSSCSSSSSCNKSSCEGCPQKDKPHDFSEPMNAFSHIRHVIGVVSGKGGVGKSFVTSSLAVAMAKEGYRVGILDGDITGPSIPKMFGAHGQLLNDERGLLPYETPHGIEIVSINLLMEDEEALLDQGITKILWYDEVPSINQWQEELKDVEFDSVTFCTSQPFFLEFFNSKVSKAVAMEKIGEIYGISREEMIAAGDGYNDLAMIEYAGLGVAMENAVDGVKAVAQYITASNEEDGIAKVIEEFIL